MLYNLVMSVIMIQIQTNNTQANTNAGGLFCSGTNPFINSWLRFFDTRRETQFLLCWPYYADPTNAWRILWCIRSQFISAGQDPKNLTAAATVENSTVCLYGPISTPNWLFFKILGWGCRIHRLHLCRGVRPAPNECPGYDTKQSDGEVPVMSKLWRIGSTLLLPSLLGPLWPGEVAPDRALSMG